MNRRTVIKWLLVGTPTTTGCLDGRADKSPAGGGTPSIECPSKPDGLDAVSAGEYALAFEKAYRVHRLRSRFDLVGPVRFFGGGGPTVEESGDGYVARFSLQVKYTHRQEDGTATDVANGPNYWVAYFVDATVTKRQRAAESGHETPTESLAPRTEGETVTCPPEA